MVTKIGPRTRRYLQAKRDPVGSVEAFMRTMERTAENIARQTIERAIAEEQKATEECIGKIRKKAEQDMEAACKALIREFKRIFKAKVDSLPHIKGDPGYTPVKGKDYFDGSPGEPGHTPMADVDYPTVASVRAMLDASAKVLYARLVRDGMTKTQVTAAIKEAGLDAKTIARSLEKLTGVDRLDYNALKNTPSSPVQFGGTLHRGGGIGTPMSVTSGDIDDSNTTFRFASIPKLVCVNGSFYRNGKGVTITGTTVVLDNPVGTDGDIYGLQ